MRITLQDKDLPDSWYNIYPDLEFTVPPPLGAHGFSLKYDDLEPLASDSIIRQELEQEEQEIVIPKPLRDLYSEYRPTPLFRAERLEKELDSPARIFYKYEGSSPSGSYEFNTAIAQAYYASQYKDSGITCLVTASGNGEWGVSTAIACNFFNLQCKIYMVKSAYEDKVFGRYLMELLGAEVIPSPSTITNAGRKILARDPDCSGSLGIALGEAYEEAFSRADTKFAWGTVMNHVLLHQTLIGLESRAQLKRVNADPDICIATVGGGSGFGGLIFPFYKKRKRDTRFIAVETAAAPSLSKGRYTWDYTDTEKMGPMLKMYTLGHSFVPPGIRAGGMRYHGISPVISTLFREQVIEAKICTQRQAFDAAITFSRTEGYVPSPESAYAIKAVIDEAMICKQENKRKNILFLLSTNSNLDITAFRDFLAGSIEDQHAQDSQINKAMEDLPQISQDKV